MAHLRDPPHVSRHAVQGGGDEQGRLRILGVLLTTGLLLLVGLAFYGIKMTHKVAGPLFKVTLYLAKMRDGRLDKVDSRFDRVDGRLDRLESGLRGLREDMPGIVGDAVRAVLRKTP